LSDTLEHEKFDADLWLREGQKGKGKKTNPQAVCKKKKKKKKKTRSVKDVYPRFKVIGGDGVILTRA